MFPDQYIENISKLPSAQQEQGLDLAPGDDAPESLWESIVNMRLQTDGMYRFWKRRGGTTEQKSVLGNILTIFGFRAFVGGANTRFIALHTDVGKIHLWDMDADTLIEIMTGFSTTGQVQFAHNGKFLYVFDYDGGQARYYDLNVASGFAFLNYKRSYIETVNLSHDEITNDNLWGFKAGVQVIVFPNANQSVEGEFLSYVTDLLEVSNGFLKWEDPKGNAASAKFGDPTIIDDLTDTNIVFPHSPDLEELVGIPSNKKIDAAGTGVIANDKYVPPVIYRGYLVIDILNDGSVAIPGRPFQFRADTDTLYQDGVTLARFTVAAAGANVARRYLCATRWQATPQAAFLPSTPDYPNSAFFIVKEMDVNRVFIEDRSIDSRLLRTVAELIPISAGIADLFGSQEIIPHSVAQFTGSLMMAGYTINRPLPKPYVNPSVAIDENIFVDIEPTTTLPNNMALAFLFQYTDGKRSQIVQTEELLQEGSTSESIPLACDQTKSFGEHTVTGGTTENGQLTITYQGVTVTVNLDTINHSAPADVAEAIRQAVVGDGNVRITASVPAGADVRYTEKRFGEEFNGNLVDIEPVLVAATGHIDVSANNIGAGLTEDHQVVVGPNSTALTTINETDTPEQIVDKYVAAVNGDATISASWTASKVDQGAGVWRCLITNDTPGAAGNDVAIDVTGETDVVLAFGTPTSGGSDGPGVTFDVEDVNLGGAAEPTGTPAKIFIRAVENNLNEGQTDTIRIIAPHPTNPSTEILPHPSVTDPEPISAILIKIRDAINGDATVSADWTAVIGDPTGGGASSHVIVTSKVAGDLNWNDLTWSIDSPSEFAIVFGVSAPGTEEVIHTFVNTVATAGAAEGCLQAAAEITVSENNLPASTSEDHTIIVDGNSTALITIVDTDTEEQIVDKYIAAVQAATLIDLEWKTGKLEVGTAWRLTLTYRQYGAIGNGRVVDVTGDTDVALTINSPSDGGSDAGNVVTEPASTINANKMQIHSLNALVSKVYILGRTGVDPNFTFHLIREVGIDQAEAHGMVIDLPNTQQQLDEIETDIFTEPTATDILEVIEINNFINIGTPFQQFSISGQKRITDQSNIIKSVPLDFDVDKTLMRYRVLLFTDANIQIGYITGSAGVFDADFEINQHGVIAEGREGITTIGDNTFFSTKNGLHVWSAGVENKLIDKRRYQVLRDNDIIDVVFNQDHNEYWFICRANTVVVLDGNSKLLRRMEFTGTDMGTLRAGAVFDDTLFIGIDGRLCATDQQGVFDDIGQGLAHGEFITAKATTKHIGNPHVQRRLLDMAVYGQTYDCTVGIDTQPARFINSPETWIKDFSGDINAGTQTIQMEGMIYPIHTRIKLARLRLTLTSNADGFVEAAELRSIPVADEGMAQT